MKESGKDAIPQLCTALLEDQDPGVRVQAALALGSVVAGANPVALGNGSPEATAALVELLGDKDDAFRLLKEYFALNPGHRALFAKGNSWWWRPLKDDPRFSELVGHTQ